MLLDGIHFVLPKRIFMWQQGQISSVENSMFDLLKCVEVYSTYTGFHQEITKTFIKPALSAAVMGVVCFLIQYAVQSVLPFGRVCFAVCVIIAVPVGALIYFAAIIKLKVFTEEELTKIPKGNLIVRLAKKLHLL